MLDQNHRAIETPQISLNRETLWTCDLIVCPTMPYTHSRFYRSLHIKQEYCLLAVLRNQVGEEDKCQGESLKRSQSSKCSIANVKVYRVEENV